MPVPMSGRSADLHGVVDRESLTTTIVPWYVSVFMDRISARKTVHRRAPAITAATRSRCRVTAQTLHLDLWLERQHHVVGLGHPCDPGMRLKARSAELAGRQLPDPEADQD